MGHDDDDDEQHCNGSKVDVSYYVNGFRADSCHNRAPFVLAVVVALFMVPVNVFIYFFRKFPNICGQICGLGLLSFYQALSSLLHTCHGLVSCYRQWMNKFSKTKVHWWTYNHYLFVSCLTSVAFGY